MTLMPGATPEPWRLVLQLLRLSRARFDMRCAEDLTSDLERLHDNISPRAYGLLTGLAVSYARPFRAGEGSPYGPLEGKWWSFPGRPDLATTHDLLLEVRDTLLAHNDTSRHRDTIVMPDWMDGKPVVTEGRSPIDAAGVPVARELFRFQHDRFSVAAEALAIRLQDSLGWKARGEINLDAELRRLRRVDA